MVSRHDICNNVYFIDIMCRMCYLLREILCLFFFFKQKTAYEMRISDWSSDVCSSDLLRDGSAQKAAAGRWLIRSRSHPGSRPARRGGQQDGGSNSRPAQRVAPNANRRLWRRGGGARRSCL